LKELAKWKEPGNQNKTVDAKRGLPEWGVGPPMNKPKHVKMADENFFCRKPDGGADTAR